MAQQSRSFTTTIKLSVRTKYLLHLPDGYRGGKSKWPLMLFLHGAGERGDDLDEVAVHGPPKLVSSEAQSLPFVLVSPQCPGDDWWSSTPRIRALGRLVDDIVSRYRIDRSRIYVTGLSMGGFGTWSLAMAYPRKFAAIVPICGGGNPAKASSIVHIPTWVFHGAKDQTVPVKRSREMVNALRRAGGKPKLTVYPDAGHDSWTATYNNPALYRWLLKQSRPGRSRQP
jgi:predicted peptidase